MKRILLYPSLHNTHDAADVFSRLNWHFSPYLQYISSIRAYASTFKNHIFSQPAPYYLDPKVGPDHAEDEFKKKTSIERNSNPTVDEWCKSFENCDLLIVWKLPKLETDKRKRKPAFNSLGDLRGSLPTHVKVVVADRHERASEASLLLSAGLQLHGNIDELTKEHHERFKSFHAKTNRQKCHILGTGPSLAELHNYDLSDGDIISCNSLVINDELMEKLRPRVICAADPIFHAGPSTYAAAFRAGLVEKMARYDFTLFVPQRDYLIYKHCLPEIYHERIIAIPFANKGVNLDLKSDFYVEPLPNVLTLLMMPIGASCYRHMKISGCDGRPLHENQYFWGHHKASQINDKMDDIKIAHPGFFNISYDDYYERHVEQVEDLCEQFEASSGIIEGLTASYVPALRKRGAAEPLRFPRLSNHKSSKTILSLNPDLKDRIGHFWNYEKKLAPEFSSMGFNYRVASNAAILEGGEFEPGDDGTIVNNGIVVDPVLMTNSFSLANRIGHRTDTLEEVSAATEAEYEEAIDRARASAIGDLLVYLYTGSLEHLEILFRIINDRPDVMVVVNLFWLKVADVWKPNFANRFGALMSLVEHDPRIQVTAMTEHQANAIKARLGIELEVAKHPSPLIGDDKADSLLSSDIEHSPDEKISIFFPSANRIEKGAQLLGSIAEHLGYMLQGRPFEFTFRSDPESGDNSGRLKQVLGDYRVLQGNIAEDDFIAELRNADVVILPYLPPDFADRTSGLAVDAAIAGTPIVVMGGTWLSECVRRYKIGTIVDVPKPINIAHAAFDIIHQNREGQVNVRKGAHAYVKEHSWSALSRQIANAVSLPGEHIWGDINTKTIKTRNEFVSPLLGQVPANAKGSIRSADLVNELASPEKQNAILVVGMDNYHTVDSFISLGKPLRVYEPSAYLAGRAKSHELFRSSDMDIQKIEAGTRQFENFIPARDGFEPNIFVSFGLKADHLQQLKDSINTSSFDVLAFGFDGHFNSQTSLTAQKCGDWLDEEGYNIVFVEHWFRPMSESFHPVRRVATYPYMSPVPFAPITLYAFKRDIALPELKAIIQNAADNCDFTEMKSHESQSAELWKRARLPEPNEIAVQLSHPGLTGWRVGGFDVLEKLSDGFTVLSESETLRVHRSTAGFTPRDGQAVTVECDIRFISASFAAIWITDAQFNVIAEATFCLSRGELISIKTPSSIVQGDVFAGITSILVSETKDWHVWVSLPKVNSGQDLYAHIVTRPTASGSLRSAGDAGRKIALRHLSITFQDRPCLFKMPKYSTKTSLQTKAVSSENAHDAEKSAPSKIDALADIQSDRNCPPSKSLENKKAQVDSDTSKKSEAEHIQSGDLLSRSIQPVSQKRKVESATPQKTIENKQQVKEFAFFQALHDIGDEKGDHPSGGWRSNGQSVVCSSDKGLKIERNGAGHADQCFIHLTLSESKEYEIVFKAKTVDPRFIILIDRRVKIDASSPGTYKIALPSPVTQITLEIKAIDSSFGTVEFSEIILRDRDRPKA